MTAPTTDTLLALQQLAQLRAHVEQLAAQQRSAADVSTLARGSHALLGALPSRYEPVLLNLLDRLEAGALFTEESCSFSQQDLLAHLQQWLDKAQDQLVPAST